MIFSQSPNPRPPKKSIKANHSKHNILPSRRKNIITTPVQFRIRRPYSGQCITAIFFPKASVNHTFVRLMRYHCATADDFQPNLGRAEHVSQREVRHHARAAGQVRPHPSTRHACISSPSGRNIEFCLCATVCLLRPILIFPV